VCVYVCVRDIYMTQRDSTQLRERVREGESERECQCVIGDADGSVVRYKCKSMKIDSAYLYLCIYRVAPYMTGFPP